jgi:outer membrane protein assembly factor BamB
MIRTLLLTALVTVGVTLAGGAVALAAPVKERPLVMPTFDGEVSALAVRGSTLYVGGSFTHAIVGSRSYARTRLAAINLTTGALLAWHPSADAKVRAIAVNDAAVFLAGDFTTINGLSRDSLAAVDLSAGAAKSFSHRVYGRPHALALWGTTLYMSGTLTSIDGTAVIGAAAFDLATGKLNPAFAPQPSKAEVRAILPTSRGVYLGGGFTGHISLVNATTGAAVPGFHSTVPYTVHGLTTADGVLYAAVAGRGGRVAAVDPVTGETWWTVTTDGDVVRVAELDGVVYFGGHYDNVCRSSNVGDMGECLDGQDRRVKLAAVDTDGMLLPWLANGNGIVGVTALISSPGLGIVAAGGQFTTINGAKMQHLAVFAR